ncbi:MAG: hypothetical protein ACREUU_07010, partial [Gammaproteobacteria bacterium]
MAYGLAAIGADAFVAMPVMWTIGKAIGLATFLAASRSPQLARAIQASSQFGIVLPFYAHIAEQGGIVLHGLWKGDLQAKDGIGLATSVGGLVLATGGLHSAGRLSANIGERIRATASTTSTSTTPAVSQGRPASLWSGTGKAFVEGVTGEAKRVALIGTSGAVSGLAGAAVFPEVGAKLFGLGAVTGGLAAGTAGQFREQNRLARVQQAYGILQQSRPGSPEFAQASTQLERDFGPSMARQISDLMDGKTTGEEVVLRTSVNWFLRGVGVRPTEVKLNAETAKQSFLSSRMTLDGARSIAAGGSAYIEVGGKPFELAASDATVRGVAQIKLAENAGLLGTSKLMDLAQGRAVAIDSPLPGAKAVTIGGTAAPPLLKSYAIDAVAERIAGTDATVGRGRGGNRIGLMQPGTHAIDNNALSPGERRIHDLLGDRAENVVVDGISLPVSGSLRQAVARHVVSG